MASRIGGLFDAYDFFGKSIPGAVWVTGIVLLLPTETALLDSTVSLNVRNFAVFAIVGLAVGLIFGEAVHTLAITIERAFAWVEGLFRETRRSVDLDEATRAVKFILGIEGSEKYTTDTGYLNQIAARIPNSGSVSQLGPLFGLIMIGVSVSVAIFGLVPGIVYLLAIGTYAPLAMIPLRYSPIGRRIEEYLREAKDPYEESSPVYSPVGALLAFSQWINSRKIEIYEGLVPHRRLFEERVEAHYLPESKDEFKLNRLEEAINAEFDNPRDGDVQGNLTDIYAAINTRLQVIDARRADNFHSRYSFCRSMWVTLGTFTVIYTFVYIHSNFTQVSEWLGQLEEIIQSPTGSATTPIAVLGLLLTTFAIGVAGQYLIGKTRFFDSYRSRQGYLAAFGCYYGILILLFSWSTAFENTTLWIGKEAMLLVTGSVGQLFGFLNSTVLLYEQAVSTKISVSKLVIAESVAPVFAPLIVSMAIATIVFFDAAGDYKDYYIQYLIVEFGEAVGMKEEYEVSLNRELSVDLDDGGKN